MNSLELTASITALANVMANDLTADELNLLAASVAQLGDTLATIAARKSICETVCESKENNISLK